MALEPTFLLCRSTNCFFVHKFLQVYHELASQSCLPVSHTNCHLSGISVPWLVSDLSRRHAVEVDSSFSDTNVEQGCCDKLS